MKVSKATFGPTFFLILAIFNWTNFVGLTMAGDVFAVISLAGTLVCSAMLRAYGRLR